MQADTGPSPFMHEKAFGIKLPGMYSRNSNEGLEYQVRLLENEQGETRLTADIDLAPVMAEIYRAENYTEETQEEIEELKPTAESPNTKPSETKIEGTIVILYRLQMPSRLIAPGKTIINYKDLSSCL